MKTTSTYKLQRLADAIKQGEKPAVLIRGERETRQVSKLRNHAHSIELTLVKNGGYLIVDPDDILLVLVRSRPSDANA